MIIVNIFGGLGNQMFQYALGRHLSYKLKTDLKFDLSFNQNRTDFDPRDIVSMFDVFDVECKTATKEEIEKFRLQSREFSAKWFYFLVKKKFSRFFWNRYAYLDIDEPYFHFNKDILDVTNHCYLSGYWQSEKYFKDIGNIIREEFCIKKPLQGDNVTVAGEIEHTNSVSMHLRGRDYVSSEKMSAEYFTCDHSYYERCISFFLKKVQRPHFFIFSDDPEWAKSYLRINHPCTFVEGNSWNKTSYQDMRLMSLCKHNIIANSSFSWWGAWLNACPNKIVLAPKAWFNDEKKNSETFDLIPPGWIRL